MAEFAVAAVCFLALCVIARWANDRFREQDRLPMQWSLGGSVNWYAPRRVALALIPAMAPFMFALIIVLPPRPGQENLVVPILVGVGAASAAIQLLHIWLIDKTLKRAGN